MKMQATEIKLTEDLKPEEIVSVYSGKQETCMCGCAGKYSYNPAHQDFASKNRGYEVTDDELNINMINKVIKAMNERRDELEIFQSTHGGQWIITLRDATKAGGRWYVAYSTVDESHELVTK